MSAWRNPGLYVLKALTFFLSDSSFGTRSLSLDTPCLRRHRSSADRDMFGLMNSLTTASRSSRGRRSDVRSSTTISSSRGESVALRFQGRCERSSTVSLFFHFLTVALVIPYLAARALSEREDCWVSLLTAGVVRAFLCNLISMVLHYRASLGDPLWLHDLGARHEASPIVQPQRVLIYSGSSRPLNMCLARNKGQDLLGI